MTDKRPLIIYHANCPDGMTAAWIAKQKHPDAELYPAKYGDLPPDIFGRLVFVLDFSYPHKVMLEMADSVSELWVIDHHKTAAADCAGLPFCTFDMEKSGARLTWEHFHTRWPPALDMVLYVEDSDLWRFALPQSREVRAFVQSFPFTMESWDDLMATPIASASRIGKHLVRYRTQQIETFVLANATVAWVFFDDAAKRTVVLSTPVFISDACHLALERFPEAILAMNFYRRPDGNWVHDLRSRSGSDVDVGALAKLHGGGGHKHAAGFTSDSPHT